MERLILGAFAAIALFLVGGCSDGHGTVGPTTPTSGNGNPGTTAVTPKPTTAALFQPLQGILPYPTDLYFAGSTDGTLNIQPPNALMPNQAAINALDGFSTTAVIRAGFGGALNPASLTAASVIVIQVSIDNKTKATTGVVKPLVFGTDYTVGVGPEAVVGSSILEIHPTHPLVPSTGVTNNGYLVLLTNGITDASGNAATPDTDYANIKTALPTCATITNTSLNGICMLTGAHLQIAQALGVNPANVVLSFSFSTQSISDTLAFISATTTAQPIAAHSIGITTKQANPLLKGDATVYVGTLTIPYYLSKSAPLTGYWLGNGSPLDSTSHFLTRFNPIPVPTQTLQIPLLITVPNANSPSGGVTPAGGWPVLIFQHGITRSRTDMLAVADSFADSGFVVVAIDLPLHGITDPTNPLYASGANPLYAGLSLPATGSIERTFDLDVLNNTTLAPGPDGKIDPSGSSFINLTSLLTARDNLREAAADMIALTRSLPSLSLGAAGAINPAGIHFLGHSLGAITGTVFLGVTTSSDVGTATLAMPGGGIADLLRESPAFSAQITAGLEAASQGLIAPGTTPFEQFFRDAQTAIDSGDPVNYIAAAATNHPIHLIQVVGGGANLPDQVVPNSATQRLLAAAPVLTRIPAPAAPGPQINPSGFRAYLNFTAGNHGSIIDPTASLAVTTEMQGEAITFTGAPLPPVPALMFPGFPATPSGTAILILNPTVLQP